MPMKQLYDIEDANIGYNHTVTSLVGYLFHHEIFNIRDFSDRQLMTSLCIMGIFAIANFVVYDNKKQLKLCSTCVTTINCFVSVHLCRIYRSCCNLLMIFEKLLCTVVS